MDPVCGFDLVIIAHASSGLVAFSASCTHSCCGLTFTGQDFVCPCHGSRFDLTGTVTVGPASEPLQVIPVCADSCGVEITIP